MFLCAKEPELYAQVTTQIDITSYIPANIHISI